MQLSLLFMSSTSVTNNWSTCNSKPEYCNNPTMNSKNKHSALTPFVATFVKRDLFEKDMFEGDLLERYVIKEIVYMGKKSFMELQANANTRFGLHNRPSFL